MLAGLIRSTSNRFAHHVYTLIGADDFFDLGPGVVTSGRGRRGSANLAMARDLRACVARVRPDIVHTWMYHANLASVLASLQVPQILWSIHNGNLTVADSKRTTRIVSALCARLSRFVPDRIVYVSSDVRAIHEGAGYCAGVGVVIPVGVDLERFNARRFDARPPGAGTKRPVEIAVVARYDPVKGQHFLIETIARHPARERLRLHFVGRGCDTAPELRQHLEQVGLLAQSNLRSPIRKIEEVYASVDVMVLPSFNEALPVSLIEAAAMEKLVCASRVGDVPNMGFPERYLFEPGNEKSCAAALSIVIDEAGRADAGFALRERVARRFALADVAARYIELYHELTDGKRA